MTSFKMESPGLAVSNQPDPYAPVPPRVVDGIGEIADRLERAFGRERALAVVERWAETDDRRWGRVAELLRLRQREVAP